ncbi:MAG: leucine-rich repeat domain-containing protein [Ruminococcus sp.]|nr:leucine-rich repeat domain-containing protein [Ruminococcus sp.]
MKDYRKRILSIAVAATLSACAVPQISPVQVKPVLTASATENPAGSFTYTETDAGYIVITGYTGSSTDVVVPDSIGGKPVTEIGSAAFAYYKTQKYLTSVKLPSGLTVIGNNAFSGQTELKEISLPDNLTSIGSGAFGSSGLTSISIPQSVTEIGSQAFSSCSKLSVIDIPENIVNFGADAFRGTEWLTIQQNSNPLVIVNGVLIDGKACEGDVTVPNTVKSIAGNAFSSPTCQLTSISIPDSVTSIGDDAFCNCAKLERVKLSNNVAEIGARTFKDCAKLKDITLPSNVKTIGYWSFNGCSSLRSLVIPDGTESIDAQAFLLCSNFETVKIPASVKSIGGMAFGGCSNLTIFGYSDSFAASYAESFDAKRFGISFTEMTVTGSAFTSVSLTLKDDLGLNFYIDGISNDEEAAEYTVVFSGKCDEAGTPVNITKKGGKYCVTANVNADSMDEIITAKLLKGDKTADIYSYSVSSYLNSVDTSDSKELAALVAATKKYGAVSKAYFNTPENMPQVDDHSADYSKASFKPVKNENDMISLVLGSKLAARLYVDGLAKDATATFGTDKVLYAKKGLNGRYCFEITNITPGELASDITVRYGETTYTFKPLSWSYLVAKNNASSDKNKAMSNVLYEYYTSADAYINTLNS